MKKPHKHAELIKAWADGAEIEEKYYDGIWRPFNDGQWMDNNPWEYRIKPEPKPDFFKYAFAKNFGVGVGDLTSDKWPEDNLKLTFDGETGRLKAAEVLQ